MSQDSELGLARELNKLLRKRRVTVAVAESSSGGRIGERLVRYAGATAYFKGAVVAYDYPSRTSLLGIPQELLQQHGSVSGEVVRTMAEAVRRRFQVDLGLASTGVTGPTGNGVGHLWLAIASEQGTDVEEHWLTPAPRLALQQQFTVLALRLLRNALSP